MLRFAPLLALSVGCATRSADLPSAAEERWEAWLWQSTDDPHGAFLLFAPDQVARELAEVADLTGYAIRPATPDDFRRSWPVLNAHRASGGAEVAYEATVPADVAFVNLWVELVVARAGGHTFGPAAERYLESLL